MNWNQVKSLDDMPKNGEIFLSFYRGTICLTQFDEITNCFYIIFDPAIADKPSKIEKDREHKFTHWMELPSIPVNYWCVESE